MGCPKNWLGVRECWVFSILIKESHHLNDIFFIFQQNSSLGALGTLAHRLQYRTACNSAPPIMLHWKVEKNNFHTTVTPHLYQMKRCFSHFCLNNFKKKQAGAELCQAQGKFKLVWLWLALGFANLAQESNFGALLWFLWISEFGLVWLVWFCRFGLVGLVLKVWFGLIGLILQIWVGLVILKLS